MSNKNLTKMKRLGKLGIAAMMTVAGAVTAAAQDNVEATLSADVVNQYVWRGTKCGDVSVQPTLGVSYKGFSLTAWGHRTGAEDRRRLSLGT